MSAELHGACYCGAVQYRITEEVRLVLNCHCNSCRKRNGASFSTYCVVSQNGLKLLQGQETLSAYEVPEKGTTLFCSKCGSPLYNINSQYPGLYMIHFGSLSEHMALTPRFNIFCENKLPWVDAIASIKSFEKAMQLR